MKKNILVSTLLIIYLLLSLLTYFVWDNKLKNLTFPTGDEPHYLVMASGIGKHAVLDQTLPYQEEFSKPEIYPGLAQTHTMPQNPTCSTHGMFSIHGIGLSVIGALPFLLGGTSGVKLFLILFSSLGVILAWKISGLFSDNLKKRFFSTLATTIAYPLIPASMQVYPEICTGIITLAGMYWFMTSNRARSLIQEGGLAIAILFLPWMHFKYSAVCVILLASISLKIFTESKNLKRISLIVGLSILSCALFLFYNYYAFGHFLGPLYCPEVGSIQEISKTRFMALLGLHFDQNQGLFLQNPIFFIGLLSIGKFFFYDKKVFLLWLFLYLSFIIPSAMHINIYGGGSFSGRFEWPAAILFFLPTLLGLIKLSEVSPKAFWTVIGASLLFQVIFFYQYLFTIIDVTNRLISTQPNDYSVHYSWIHSWLPALYDINWAGSYYPNYSWFVFTFLLLFLGFLTAKNNKKFLPKYGSFLIVISLLGILGAGFVSA